VVLGQRPPPHSSGAGAPTVWLIGCEVNRARLVADVLGELADLTPGSPGDAIVLRDGQGRTLNRWGAGDEATPVRASVPCNRRSPPGA